MRTFDNPAINRCLADIHAKAAAHGVTVVLGEEARVPYGTNASLLVSGYFIDSSVAMPIPWLRSGVRSARNANCALPGFSEAARA